ncbi:MAG TPA: c-type cytochrome domain-containing protein [Saprospiraceae bacterium]|nr:c-type cytochrome domain-containing protein [Saprospiraceae bacterium]
MKSYKLFSLIFTLIIMTASSCKYDPVTLDNPGNNGGGVDTTGTEPGGNTCSTDSVYFNKDILPLFSSSCALPGCHDAISKQEGINMTDFNSILKEIDKGKATNSKIYKVLIEKDPDKRMPRPPSLALTQDKIDLIAKWINQGAKNNSCTEGEACDISNVTYSISIKPILTKYCIGCHSGGSPQAGIDLSNYNTVQTYAKNGKLNGVVNWLSGYTPMPYKSTQLNPCNLSKIKAWIDEGSLNN